LTNDTALDLVTQAGLQIRPSRVKGKLYAFLVPGAAGALRLVLRAARPCDVLGSYRDDRRRLRVLVGAIKFCGQAPSGAVQPHLSAATLPVFSIISLLWKNVALMDSQRIPKINHSAGEK
jgi:hypothetical protein